MGPSRDGGLGSSAAAVLTAVVVVVAVAVMIHIAGGVDHPLLASPHALAMGRVTNPG